MTRSIHPQMMDARASQDLMIRFRAFCGRSKLTRLLHQTRGSMAVEFAFIMPMLFLMIFGVGQMSFALYLSFNMHSVMQEAARVAVANENMTTAQIQNLAQGQLSGVMAADAKVTASIQNLAGVDFVEVTGVYIHHISVPFMPTIDMPIRSEVRVPRGAV